MKCNGGSDSVEICSHVVVPNASSVDEKNTELGNLVYYPCYVRALVQYLSNFKAVFLRWGGGEVGIVEVVGKIPKT